MKNLEGQLKGGAYELVAEYYSTIRHNPKLAPKTKRVIRTHLSRYLAYLGGRMPSAELFLDSLKDMQGRGYVSTTLREYMKYVRNFHRWADPRTPNVVKDVVFKLPSRPFKKDTFTKEEYERIKAAVPAKLLGPCIIAYNTGFRLSDVCLLQWEHIDMEAMWIRYMPRKTCRFGTIARIPIVPNSELAEYLKDWKRLSGGIGFLFPDLAEFYRYADKEPKHKLHSDFTDVLKKIGINGKSFHTFRRTFITNVMSSGVDSLVAREFTGIRNVNTLMHYFVPSDNALKNALQRTVSFINSQ